MLLEEERKVVANQSNNNAIQGQIMLYNTNNKWDGITFFLVIDSINTKQIDAEQIKVLKHTFGLYDDYTKEGKLKVCYAFADKPGIISVWDVESNEELQRILFLLPSLSIIDRTVKPLTELKSLVSVTGELQQIVSYISKGKYEEEKSIK